MIFWMRRTAATSKRSCTGASTPHWRSVAWRWCSPRSSRSAGRPGLERALFLWSAVQATGQSSAPLVGIVAGLGVAVVLGYLLYRRAVALNLAKFFTYTAAGLVVVAAGVLAHGVHDLQEGGLLPGRSTLAFDVTPSVP